MSLAKGGEGHVPECRSLRSDRHSLPFDRRSLRSDRRSLPFERHSEVSLQEMRRLERTHLSEGYRMAHRDYLPRNDAESPPNLPIDEAGKRVGATNSYPHGTLSNRARLLAGAI
jgi:hypothetical protein